MSRKKDNSCCVKKTSIGGQALMEGIMMRGPETTAMAVRNTQGEIVLEKFPTETKKRAKFFKLPIIRGLFNYIDSMTMGTKCLMRSAEISGLEEAEEELRREKEAKKAAKAAKKAEKKGNAMQNDEQITAEATDTATTDDPACETESNEESLAEKTTEKKESSAMTAIVMTIGTVLGILLSIGLFFVLPTVIYTGATYVMPFLKHENEAVQSLIKSVFEGILKIVLIVGYMALMTLMKDIKRTFQFHGAEHKTIFCYEAGLELTVENVRKQRRFHPRCGTSFLILMVLVSILISFFIDPLFLLAFGFVPQMLIRILIKLLLLPLIVGIGYELIKIAGKHDNWLTRIISAPGVWLQHITVLEPDDSMIECAIVAMKEVIPENDTDKW
ncbi:MAG: DUF1385 domain-containing protein [Ruminococcaceae bacterium]|nr:DUF1385 domain-containing protein [Oscillospiraceae bacterium]